MKSHSTPSVRLRCRRTLDSNPKRRLRRLRRRTPKPAGSWKGGNIFRAGKIAFLVLALGVLNPWLIDAGQPNGPSSPADELASFRLADDRLAVELVAAEPNVISPVAIAWDSDGRMFVAEMMDYPLGPGTGQIRLLEDLDGDGKYEKATVFTDKLPFPNGVLPWKDGLLVTAAPNIWFLKDTDGDGRADERRVLFTGFGEGNQQLRVNGLMWGLDNWVYGANGRNDGEVRRPGDSATNAISIRRRDFRFRPDTGEFEAIAGPSQFGLGRDDWGDRFLSWNTIPIRHAVFEERYLNRNPHLPATEAIRNLLPSSDTGQVFPLTPPPLVFNSESSSHFNALAGLTIYRGNALGPAYGGNAFVGESLRNLIHRRVLEPDGATFVARRGEEGKEFLASTDPWFHAVNFATGPDGALYVADFYRQFVEHPLYVPEGLRNSQPWRTGAEHGRIWRIKAKAGPTARLPSGGVPTSSRRRPTSPVPSLKSEIRNPKPIIGGALRSNLSRATTAELVAQLGNENAWWRDTAQRLLVKRQDQADFPLLKSALRTPHSAFALARLHALWTLEGLHALDGDVILRALRDKHPRVRENAVRLAEEFLTLGGDAVHSAPNSRPLDGPPKNIRDGVESVPTGLLGRTVLSPSNRRKIQEALLRLAADPDSRVRFQLALTLGELRAPEHLAALTKLARQGVRSRLEGLAILIGVGDNLVPFLQAMIRQDPSWFNSPTDEQGAFLEETGRAVGAARRAADTEAVLTLIGDSASASGSLRLLAGLADGLGQADQSLREWLSQPVVLVQGRGDASSRLVTNAVAVALSGSAAFPLRIAALRVLARSPADRSGPALLQLSLQDLSPEIRNAAARAIPELSDGNSASVLFANWTKLSTVQRRQALAVVTRSLASLGALLDAIERGDVQAAELDVAGRQRLQQIQDAGLKPRIEKLFGKSKATDRAEAIRNYQAALRLAGDPPRGAMIFAKTCLACHSIQGQGGHVGPDLMGIASRPKEALLTDILDPSQQMVPDFLNYRLVPRTGEAVSGLIVAETANSVTLRRVGEPDVTTLRRDISELQAEGKSAMPDGLEQGMSLQDMADLLEFLRRPEKALLPR